jgi:hypothetical protein
VAEFVGTNETILSMRVWSFLNWITADECVISTFLFHYSIEAYVLKEKKHMWLEDYPSWMPSLRVVRALSTLVVILMSRAC